MVLQMLCSPLVCVCVCVSHVAVYVLQSVSGVGHRQICVQDEAQAAGRLVVMEAVLAGLKGQEALLPAERQQFRTADRQTDRTIKVCNNGSLKVKTCPIRFCVNNNCPSGSQPTNQLTGPHDQRATMRRF